MITRYYLDTNAISALFRDTGTRGEQPRESLVRGIRGGHSSVLFSANLLDELAPVALDDRDLYDRITDLLWLRGNNLLRSTMTLARLEIANAGPLADREPFETRAGRRDTRMAYKRRGFLAERVADVRRQTEAFKREEEARRDDVRQTVAASPHIKRSLAHESRAWWEDAAQHIDEWIRESWTAEPDSYGLAADPKTWPKPDSVPTVWGMFAFKMARMHLNIGENRRVDATDLYDAHHYVAASYGDCLVTNDARFTETCRLIPTTRFQVVDVNAFANTVGGLPATPGLSIHNR